MENTNLSKHSQEVYSSECGSPSKLKLDKNFVESYPVNEGLVDSIFPVFLFLVLNTTNVWYMGYL